MPPKHARVPSTSTSKSLVAISGSKSVAARGSLSLQAGYAILVASSLITSSVLYTLVSPFISSELSAVSRRLDNGYEITALVLWRMIELAVGWWGRFDGIDFAALMVSSHLPTAILLNTFHSIPMSTVAITFVVDLISLAGPVLALRPNAPAHQTPSNLPLRLPNRNILSSPAIFVYISALATILLTLPFYAQLRTVLPGLLVRGFDNVTTLRPAYESNLPLLSAELLPLGVLAFAFIFEPAIAIQQPSAQKPFHPETATFAETVEHNVWGNMRKRTRFVIERTAILALAAFVGTTVRVGATIGGSTLLGAAGWATSFSVGVLAAGAGLWWVGHAPA